MDNRNIRKGFILVAVYIFFTAVIIVNLLPFFDDDDSLMDFGSFYASGLKIRSGENPYDPNSEYIFEINFSRVGAGGKMANLNPPVSIVFFRWLSRFDPHRTLIVWQAASAILYAGVVSMLAARYKQNLTPTKLLWAFTLAGFWHTLVLGQVYIVILLFAALGWLLLRREKQILAGLAIGIVIALKPNFFVWSLFLLAGGYYMAFLVSTLSGLAISAIPALLYGPGIYAQWLEASALRRATLIMPGNNSIVGLASRFDAMSIGIAVGVLIVLVLLIWSRTKRPEDMEIPEYYSALGILASLLASPISWTGYTILLLPVFFSIKKWTPLIATSAAILSIPFAIVLQLWQNSFANFVIFGWLYGWAILLLLGSVVAKTMTTRSIQTN